MNCLRCLEPPQTAFDDFNGSREWFCPECGFFWAIEAPYNDDRSMHNIYGSHMRNPKKIPEGTLLIAASEGI